jgi:hypothetical protein
VRFAVSEDGARFVEVGRAGPPLTPAEPGPEISVLLAEGLGSRGRWVKVRAANVGAIPPGRSAAGTPAWLFVDEILVNPRPDATRR